MSIAINHVHIRSLDPHTSADWYENHFDAKKVFDAEVTPGSITIVMQLEGPVTLNISSQPKGASQEEAVAKLNHLGLEHFGFVVDDLKAMVDRLETAGVRIIQPLTDVPGKTRLAYIEGPDGVLIELNQPYPNPSDSD